MLLQALTTSDVTYEIAGHLERMTLARFIRVSRSFHRAGVGRLWRNMGSLVPLLDVLIPPTGQPLDSSHLQWEAFLFYASLIRSLNLTLTPEALGPYKKDFFTMLKSRQPRCLSSITTLRLSIASSSTDLLFILGLLANAQITTLKILGSIENIYACLHPLQLHSITHLILHALPLQQLFWSSLVESWAQLTVLHIEHDETDEIYAYGWIFGSISKLPMLQELHANCVGSIDTQMIFRFPRLERLAVKFGPHSNPTDLVMKLNAPHLAQLTITPGEFLTEPMFASLFHSISTQCNHSSLIALTVELPELESDYPPEVPEEFRQEAFREATVSPLYSFSFLEHLEICPGISCHDLPDGFYANIPLCWPRIKVFHLGGDLYYPASSPVATLRGVAGFLSNSGEIQQLSFPHIRGTTLPPADKVYSTLKKIGNLFGEGDVLPSYLDWVDACMPSVESVGIANDPRYEAKIRRYSVRFDCVDLLAYGAE